MDREQYTRELCIRCRQHPVYLNQIQAEGGPMIGVIGFDNYPAPGRFTYFSEGLHRLNKPEWIAGRPEYFITIDNADRRFALFFAYLLSAFAVEKVMGWNTLIGAGEDDAVEGYPYRRIALGPPRYLDWLTYELPEENHLPINFGMAHFVSDFDFETAAKTGVRYLEQKLEQNPDYWWKIESRNSKQGPQQPSLWARLRGVLGKKSVPTRPPQSADEISRSWYAQHGLVAVCSKQCIGPNRLPIRHAVREQSKNVADSGWMLASGEESEAYANDPRNYVLTPLNRLVETDPTLRILCDQPVGAELTRKSPEQPWRWIVDDKVVDEDGNVVAEL